MDKRQPIVSTWRGEPRYACPAENCQFDHTSKAVVLDHMNVMHRVLDENGTDITPVVEIGDPKLELIANNQVLLDSMAPTQPVEEKVEGDAKSIKERKKGE